MLNCNYCDKKGLLIYPVRYAVASPYGAAGVPGLSGNFRIENGPQQIGEARYTLRALRAGYLYTYDERRGRFKAYVVMPTGHLWNFPLHYRAPHPSRIPFSCVEPGEIVRAYCLDIAHTPQDPATRIWIGWSNTEWTKALQKRVGDLGWRRKHMQCIDVEAMLAGSAAHTGEFGASVNLLAHFAADHSAMDKAFSFSNTPPTEEKKRHAWAGKMRDVMAAQIPHHKGFVVAVNDPVGITNDLSELTVPGLDAGFDEKLCQSKIVADILAMTEQRVRQEASDDIDFRDKVAEISENNPDGDTYNSIKTMLAMIKAGVHLYLLAGGRIKASKMSAADVARWAIAQAQEQGIKLDTHPRTTKSNAYREARSAVNRHRPDKYLFAYELDIARLESEGHIAPGSIKGIGVPGIAQAQKWLGSSVPREFKLGAVTALVQMLALTFAMKDLANNDQFNEEETRVKAILAAVSLGATIVETVAVSVGKSVEHPLGAFIQRQWAMDSKMVAKIIQGARLVGAGAGVMAGVSVATKWMKAAM